MPREEPSQRSTYRIHPVLAPLLKLAGFSLVFLLVTLAITGPKILMNLEQAKQSPYWADLMVLLQMTPFVVALVIIGAVMVYYEPRLLFQEVEHRDK